jgi:hypothetical protein
VLDLPRAGRERGSAGRALVPETGPHRGPHRGRHGGPGDPPHGWRPRAGLVTTGESAMSAYVRYGNCRRVLFPRSRLRSSRLFAARFSKGGARQGRNAPSWAEDCYPDPWEAAKRRRSDRDGATRPDRVVVGCVPNGHRRVEAVPAGIRNDGQCGHGGARDAGGTQAGQGVALRCPREISGPMVRPGSQVQEDVRRWSPARSLA